MQSLENNGDGFEGVRRQPNGTLAQNPMTNYAATPAERRSVFGRAHVDLNDNLTAFAQATYSNIAVKTRGGYSPAITVWQAPIPNDGLRPLPPGLQALLDSRTFDPDGGGPLLPGDPTGPSAASTPWNLFRGIDFMGARSEPTNETNAYQVMAGVEGSFANRDWTWEAYVSTGRHEHHELLRQPTVAAALSVPRGAAELGRHGAGSDVHHGPQLHVVLRHRLADVLDGRSGPGLHRGHRGEGCGRPGTSPRTSSRRTCRARSPT